MVYCMVYTIWYIPWYITYYISLLNDIYHGIYHGIYHMVYTIWYIPIAAWYIPSKNGIYHEATFQMVESSDHGPNGRTGTRIGTGRTAAGRAGSFNPEEHRSSRLRPFGPSLREERLCSSSPKEGKNERSFRTDDPAQPAAGRPSLRPFVSVLRPRPRGACLVLSRPTKSVACCSFFAYDASALVSLLVPDSPPRRAPIPRSRRSLPTRLPPGCSSASPKIRLDVRLSFALDPFPVLSLLS
jgi:hypothetical protein